MKATDSGTPVPQGLAATGGPEAGYSIFLGDKGRVAALKDFLDAAAEIGRRKRLALAESNSKPAA